MSDSVAQNAIVTGAGSGNGKAIAELLFPKELTSHYSISRQNPSQTQHPGSPLRYPSAWTSQIQNQ